MSLALYLQGFDASEVEDLRLDGLASSPREFLAEPRNPVERPREAQAAGYGPRISIHASHELRVEIAVLVSVVVSQQSAHV